MTITPAKAETVWGSSGQGASQETCILTAVLPLSSQSIQILVSVGHWASVSPSENEGLRLNPL